MPAGACVPCPCIFFTLRLEVNSEIFSCPLLQAALAYRGKRMKLSLRLIPILAIAITLVTFVVARNQVRSEKRGLQADLERRAELLAESLQETVEPVLQKGATSQLRRIVERFGNREHLVGIAIYDAEGKALAMSSKLDSYVQAPPAVFEQSEEKNVGVGSYAPIGQLTMYVYAVPLHRGSEVAGVLVLFHDASYIEAQSSRIWRDALWHVVVQVLLIMLITFFVVRWTIVGPITRVAHWMRDLRNGKVAPFPYRVAEGFLGPLSTEAATLAQKLAEARASAKEEARLREAGDSLWTADRLRAKIQKRLDGRSLFVVSNREPYEHVHGSRGIEIRVPASGLVTALEPILCACDGTWIAHGAARCRSPDRRRQRPLARSSRSSSLHAAACLADEGRGERLLLRLCKRRHLAALPYRAYAARFSRRGLGTLPARQREIRAGLLEEIEGAEQPFVLIQDYHFALASAPDQGSAARRPCRYFLAYPVAQCRSVRICPWERELLEGLLGADLVGFHIQAHCNNFLETVDQAIQCRIEWDRFTVNRNEHLTLVRPLPHQRGVAGRRDEMRRTKFRRSRIASAVLAAAGSGDPVPGSRALTASITPRGSWSASAPSSACSKNIRTIASNSRLCNSARPAARHIKRYQDLFDDVEAEADRINAAFRRSRWKPIVFFNRHHSHRGNRSRSTRPRIFAW